jgi:hypothetical protein
MLADHDRDIVIPIRTDPEYTAGATSLECEFNVDTRIESITILIA